MKYLKLFELYNHPQAPKEEDKISDEIFNDIEDILLEISDMYINIVSVNGHYYYPESSDRRPAIVIDLESEAHSYFYLRTDSILDCILRLKEYVESNGCEMVAQNIPDNQDDYTKIDDFIEEYSGEDLYEIQLIIYTVNEISKEI